MNTIVSTQYLLPQAVVANGAVTANGWSNPNDILFVDGNVAASNPNQTASDITIGNFPTALPQNAVIVGLEFKLIAKRGAQTSPVITLTPSFLDDTSGNDVYYPYITPITTALTPNLTTIIFGGPTYLFASAFTPNQINNAKLNFTANGDVSIDSCLMRVYYYIPSTITPPPPVGPGCVDCNSPIQAQPFYLALPFKSGDQFAYFQSFNYPDGTPIQYGDLGSCGGYIDFVFDPARPKIGNSNFEENARSASWTVQPNGWVKFDFGPISSFRGLQFHTPYAPDPNLRSDHDANSKVIISDNSPFLGQLLRQCQIGSVVSAPIIVENQNVPLPTPATDLDFQGAGVSTANDGITPGRKIITIPGAGGTTPPQIVSTTSASSGNVQVTTLTAILQVSGLNRGVPIQISTEQLTTVLSVDVGGTPAVSQVVSTDVGANIREETWFCPNPPLGPQTITITLSIAAYLTFGAECVNGLDPVSPVGATQSATGTSLNPTLAIVTTRDYSIVIDGLATAQTPILYTPGAGQGSNWALFSNSTTRQGGSSVESAGTQPDTITMDYAITQNTTWCYTAIELKGITATVPGSGQSAIQFEDETGTPLGIPGTVDEVEVTGSSKGTRVGNKVTYDVGTMVSVADTTPDFLDPKLNIHSSDASVNINKTITNPGANEVLDYDLTVALGSGSGTKLAIDTTQTVVFNTLVETTIFTVPIPANTLGTNDAIRFKVLFDTFSIDANKITTVRVKYGGTTIGTLTIGSASTGGLIDVPLTLEGVLVANNSTGSQKSQVTGEWGPGAGGAGAGQFNVPSDYVLCAENSTTPLNLVVTLQQNSLGNTAKAEGIIVEKISSSGSGGIPTVQVFTANGTYTKPAGLKYAVVENVGGGAGGDNGNGGGAGGYSKKIIDAALIGATETVIVGAGGGPVADGGTSSFGAFNSATGGTHGGPGIGGIGIGGDLNVQGGDGHVNDSFATSTSGSGQSGGNGGSSVLGGGGYGTLANNGAGANGHQYGGGGGGKEGVGTDGSGAGGVVIVTEYYS